MKKNIQIDAFLALCVVTLILSPSVAASDVDVALSAKQQIERKLEEDWQMFKFLSAFVNNSKSPNNEWQRRSLKRSFNQLRALEEFVKKQEPDVLPQALVKLFIDERNNLSFKYPSLSYYVRTLGEPAVKPLMENYNRISRLDQNGKRHVLGILNDIGSPTALPLIRQETHSPNLEIRAAAIRLLYRLMGKEAKAELYQLLEEPNQALSIITLILEQLKNISEPEWRTTVISMIQQEKLPLEYLLRFKLDDFHDAEHVIGSRIPVLLEQLQSEKLQNRKNAIKLLLVLKHRTYLKQLFPILDDLLRVRFYYGKTFYWRYQKDSHSDIDFDKFSWNFTNTQLILGRIETELYTADIKEWLAKQPKSLLTTLYLEQLLIKKGELSQKMSLEEVLVEVLVLDSQGTVLIKVRRLVPLDGQKVVLAGKLHVSDYPLRYYEGYFTFDSDKLQIVIDSLSIRTIPSDSMPPPEPFDRRTGQYENYGLHVDEARFPLGGAWEIHLRNDQKQFKWMIRHVE
jgi:hypothetical protein